MLFRPIPLTWRGLLSVKHQHFHAHQPLPFLTVRKVHSDSTTPSLGLAESEQEEDGNFDPSEQPDPSQSLTRPSEIVADKRLKPRKNSWKQKLGGKGVPPRQVTLEAKRPAITSQQQVLVALKRFRTTSTYWQEFSKDPDQAVVILATPSFAKWLEEDSFIIRFLEKITRSTLDDQRIRAATEAQLNKGVTPHPFEINVLCACIDGLSPGVKFMPYMIGRRAKEGFSVLQGRTSDILPNLWDVENSNTAKSPTMTSTLTFANASKSQNRSQVVLPLANTLFLNGRHSTLLVSKWKLERGSFVKVKSLEKRNQAITVFDGRELGRHSTRVPAAPLTPARRIISGLGNIVKQIDFGEDNPGPASRELEANIDEYLLQTRREKSTIAVWALIVPKTSISNQQPPAPAYELLSDTDRVKIQWQVVLPSPDFIGHWLSQGAKFCRVLSGGGGWGVKQGLLSLDPQSTFNEVSEARFDFSTGSLEDQQVSALGNIAERDALIQFFVVDSRIPKAPPYTPPSSAESQRSDVWRSNTVIGTMPSTVDDKKPSQNDSTIKHEVICRPGLFGAVSESGMFLDVSPSGKQKVRKDGASITGTPAVHTKIDLPYSYIFKDMREEKSSKIKQSELSDQPEQEESEESSFQIRKQFVESQEVHEAGVSPEQHLAADFPKKSGEISARRSQLKSAPLRVKKTTPLRIIKVEHLPKNPVREVELLPRAPVRRVEFFPKIPRKVELGPKSLELSPDGPNLQRVHTQGPRILRTNRFPGPQE